jgi:hypothetical protein
MLHIEYLTIKEKMQQYLCGVIIYKYKVTEMENKWVNDQKETPIL